MMAARNTLLLIGLSALLAGCFDRDKPSGTLKYDDTTQSTTGSGYDSGTGIGDGTAPPVVNSTPVPIDSSGEWPPPNTEPLGKVVAARRQLHVGNILQVSAKYGVEVELIHAIITRESVYDQSRRSHAGAVGLMQLMPDTGRRFGCLNVSNALCNLDAGTRFLKFLADRYNGNVRTIATGYNAGEDVSDSYLYGTKKPGKNPEGIKTPNGVPLGSFSYTPAQKARCPSNNWHPTSTCEGETYRYVRFIVGYYLLYKQHPELVGKTAAPAPSAVAHRQGRI